MTRDKLATSATPKFVSFSKGAGDIPSSNKGISSSESSNPPPVTEAQKPSDDPPTIIASPPVAPVTFLPPLEETVTPDKEPVSIASENTEVTPEVSPTSAEVEESNDGSQVGATSVDNFSSVER